jgi:hypothetical protein
VSIRHRCIDVHDLKTCGAPIDMADALLQTMKTTLATMREHLANR